MKIKHLLFAAIIIGVLLLMLRIDYLSKKELEHIPGGDIQKAINNQEY